MFSVVFVVFSDGGFVGEVFGMEGGDFAVIVFPDGGFVDDVFGTDGGDVATIVQA